LPRRQPRILVVEDDVIIAVSIERQLTDWQYRVVGQAESASEAVRLAARHRPDLILMDIRLRDETSGIDAAREIRDLHPIPVIFVTAQTDEATLANARAVGPAGIVFKPWSAALLAATIELALTHLPSPTVP
jgi:CheY-like chemotaxis protein